MLLTRNESVSKRIYQLLIGMFFGISMLGFGQISEGGLPPSFNNGFYKAAKLLKSLQLNKLDINKLELEDKSFPTPVRYSVFQDANVDLIEEGTFTKIEGGNGGFWRYIVQGEHAKSIQLFFKLFLIPDGAKLYVYNEDYTVIYGAFTNSNVSEDSTFLIADLKSDKLIIEYFEPDIVEFKGQVVLGAIGQGYKEMSLRNIQTEDYEEISVNCPEGKEWQNQKHSVCLISFKVDDSGYLCSGALVNNTSQDSKPYFLTANHCVDDYDVAKTVIAYFNYEYTGCDGALKGKNQSLSGATLLTRGGRSDYALILLDNIPPVEYQPYYAGWDLSGDEIVNGYGIHHPFGNPKTLSICDQTITSYDARLTWDNSLISPLNSHWEVEFTRGTTEEGSSGSPLFDQNNRVVGQLHGGDDEGSFYGKLSYSKKYPSLGFDPITDFIDSKGSGIQKIDGYYPVGNRPDPQIYPEFSVVCTNSPVKLNGFSAFSYENWSWSISPSTYTFAEGTNANSEQPVVVLEENGTYDVELSLKNSAGISSVTMRQLVNASDEIDININAALVDTCLCRFDSIILSASGANSYEWLLTDESKEYFTISQANGSSAVVKLSDILISKSIYPLGISVAGSQGACIDTNTFNVNLRAQRNDDISKAIKLENGINGVYSNKCAGIQENEPEPFHNSCTGQNSWCDEYRNGENIVENSVWFYFIAGSGKSYFIRSTGFDNQMAIYKAESYEDILSGNYFLIAANDDYNTTDVNPYVENLVLIDGAKYFVQVDGSGGGKEGDFYLYVDTKEIDPITSLKEISTNQFKLYPQPANDRLYIESAMLTGIGKVNVDIYNVSGVLVAKSKISDIRNSEMEIEVSELQRGLYFLKIMIGKDMYNARFIKR